MMKRIISNYPIDEKNPLYVVCEIHNQDKFYAVSKKNFLSANKKSEEPIQCIFFDVSEDEKEIVYNIKEPFKKVSFDRASWLECFMLKVKNNDYKTNLFKEPINSTFS